MTVEFASLYMEGVQIGIGKTTSGSARGLAVLEGLVAGIEARAYLQS